MCMCSMFRLQTTYLLELVNEADIQPLVAMLPLQPTLQITIRRLQAVTYRRTAACNRSRGCSWKCRSHAHARYRGCPLEEFTANVWENWSKVAMAQRLCSPNEVALRCSFVGRGRWQFLTSRHRPWGPRPYLCPCLYFSKVFGSNWVKFSSTQ